MCFLLPQMWVVEVEAGKVGGGASRTEQRVHNLQGGQGLRPLCPLADGRVHQRGPGLEAIRGEGGDGPAEDDGPEEGREGVVGDEVGALRGGHAPRGHVGLDDVFFLGHCGCRPFSLYLTLSHYGLPVTMCVARRGFSDSSRLCGW